MLGKETGTWLLLLFLYLNCINAANGEREELKLLLSFKASVTDPLRCLSDWNSSVDFCYWYGVSCINSSHVSKIELSGKNITGKLALSLFLLPSIESINLSNNQFIGKLPNATFSAFSLRYLNLSNNNFTGLIPGGFIPGLETLDLSNNMLSGDIPPDIHLFSGLKVIDIGGNVLTGEIPKSITNLRNLEFLTLASNQLVGQVPPGISQMKSLKWIYFGYNNLSGEIPKELGYLSFLNHLDLVYNNFTGEIPSSLGKLNNLQYLFLYQNRLTGPIPRSVFSLRNLVSLDLSDNYLSGDIPELVGELKNLEILHLFSNNFMGKIPVSLGSLPRLRILQLWSNQLSGSIPQNLGKGNNLTILDLSSNNLTGKIPEGLCTSGHLAKLILFSNMLEGEYPKTLCYCKSLQRIRIQNNRFSGELSPEFTKVPLVNYVDISGNHFSGRIDKHRWNMPALQMLNLAQNQFTGNLPEFFGGNKLENLDLSENNFSGSIPLSFGDLSELMQLILRENQLTGFIPEKLSSCKKLVALDLSRNQLIGPLPIGFSKMPVLSKLDLSENHLSGEIPPKLGEVQSLVQVNISYNQFYGCFPTNGVFLTINASAVAGNDLCGGDVVSGLPPCRRIKRPVNWFFIDALLVALSVFIISVFVTIFIRRRNKTQMKKAIRDEYGIWDLQFFHTKALKSITVDDILFSIKEENVISRETNGMLYQGKSVKNGMQFVVKKLTLSPSPESNFWVEMSEQGKIQHPKMVKLLGICRSEKEGILVYESVHGKKLRDIICGLSWECRLKIAIGISKVLRFVHFRYVPSLLFGNLSMDKVIIDGKNEPRLLLDLPGSVRTGCDSKGSFCSCYIAPETIERKEITEKSNVYTFGVFLIEILTGKLAADAELEVHNNIVDWANYCYSDCHATMWVDGALKEQLSSYQDEMVETMALALHCTAEDPMARPCSNDLVKKLEFVIGSASCISSLKFWL